MEPDDIFEPQLLALTRGAIERLNGTLVRHAPEIAGEVNAWITSLSRTGHPEDYFRDARAYILLIPWFADKAVRGAPDLAFQADLVYSSVNAYYFVRLIDNLMDGHGGADVQMLPILGFFHSQFQTVYTRYFPPDSAFWDFFHSTWIAMAQAAIRDASTREISAADFARVSATKSSGVKIPIAAVLYHCGRRDLVRAWCDCYDALALWNRMVDDVFDSLVDAQNGTVTYFLSQAKLRKAAGESVSAWIVREGFRWGCEQAESHLQLLTALANELGSPDLVRYVEQRRTEVASCSEMLRPALESFARLAAVLE